MKLLHFSVLLTVTFTIVNSQFPGASLLSLPWSQSNSYPSYGKPIRPSPYGYGTPGGVYGNGGGNYGTPGGSYGTPVGSYGHPASNQPVSYDDDPLPLGSIEAPSEYEFPSKLPIKAPNGVVEIYNRVVDDLIKKLKVDFEKNDIDPMSVVIRATPPGPVRVPGHMQKRPFRRPGAALVRSSNAATLSLPGATKNNEEKSFFSSESDEHQSSGPGRLTAGIETPRSNSGKSKAKPATEAPQPTSEPTFDEYPRSEENLSEEINDDLQKKSDTPKKEVVKVITLDTEDDESSEPVSKKEESTLQNRRGNAGKKKKGSNKYKSEKTSEKSNEEKEEPKKKKKPDPPSLEEDADEDLPEQEDEDEEQDEFDDHEPGNYHGPGNRPAGGYYPQDGSPVLPSKPNAELHGLSRMVRASDVVVGIDARSAVITARLLVGPLVVHINESTEPMERGLKATIPELEAEIILMERHGVVFLQRFTLDRAYGQDIEISVPKVRSKSDKKRKGSKGSANQPGIDPMHPAAIERYQTKMGAHVSMEVVKLLRSGNLRLNIMRTAQGSMTKLKLPIKDEPKSKKSRKKSKGSKRRRN